MEQGVNIMAIIENLQMEFQFSHKGYFYYKNPMGLYHETYLSIHPNMNVKQVDLIDFFQIKADYESPTE